MRKLVLVTLVALPLAGYAQTEDSDDGGFIQRLLENALSAEGREVRLEGFRGALSSTAQIDRIVMTDPDGTWFVAEEVSMQWSRAALLRGRVNINEIRIGSLDLPRLPAPAPQEAPTPEAGGPITLPELPVEIQLGALNVVTAEIGAPVIGEALTIGIAGSARLVSGEGNLALDVTRQDQPGTYRIAGSFSNATRDLGVDVAIQEPQGGLVATLANLPGQPSLDLSIAGAGPLSDFAADIALATDGQDRLTGRVALLAVPEATDDAARTGQRFTADLSGDITPLLDPIYHDFLGENIALAAEGLRDSAGAFDLQALSLSADALDLDGTARIGADGWPERFDVDLIVAPSTGTSVILPIPGDPTSLGRAEITADFDASRGSRWDLAGQIDGLSQATFAIGDITLTGGGTIDRAGPRVDARIDLDADGLAFDDPALQSAVGTALQAGLQAAWQPETPLRLSDLAVAGADYGLSGAVEIDGLGGALAVVVRPDLEVTAANLARFAAISGLDLSGAAALGLSGSLTPLEGSFDLALDGETRDLALGIEEADPILAGTGTLALAATRDTSGLNVPTLQIETDAARVSGSARAAQGTTNAVLRAEVFDTAIAVPAMRGPATLDVTADNAGTVWTVDGSADLPGDTALTLTGQLDTDTASAAESTLSLQGQVGDLSVFSQLAGQPLRGAITIDADGTGNLAARTGRLRVDGQARSLRVGIPQADGLLQGRGDIALAVERRADGRILIENLALEAGGASATGSGELLGDTPGTLQVAMRVPDLSPVVPGLRGGAQADLRATTQGTTWDVDGSLGLPGRTALDLTAFVDTASRNPARSTLSVNGRIGDLSAFSTLAGQALGGAATLQAEGTGDLATQSGQLRLDARLANLRTGIPQADGILRGNSTLALAVARQEDGTIVIDRLDLDAPGVTADGSGQLLGTAPGRLDLDVRLPNLAPIVPILPGAATVTLDANQRGAEWQVDVAANAPGNTTARVRGTAAADASRVNLAVTGNAPLAVVNAFLRGQVIEGPLSFDLAVQGPPALGSVSGTVRIGDTRISDVGSGLTLEGVRGTVALASGQARTDISGRFATGGTLSIGGPVTLSPPFNADLEILLRDAIIAQADLLETRVNGAVTISGALTGGAAIGGDLLFDPLEIQIPSIGPSYSALDGLTHEDLPEDVRQTLISARLISEDTAAGPAPSFPIDLTIRAPQRIFVRGRGLDAELGGAIRVTGRTDNIVPIGEFELLRGRLNILTRDVALDVGEVDIQGSFDPVLLFTATSTVEDVLITINLSGPASDPDLELTSVPELPEDEVLSFFLFGSGTDSISPLQAIRLANAVQVLTGSGGLNFNSALRDGLGVDAFDIDIDDDGNVEASVGTYIGENIYTDVGVNSDGETEVELNLELSDTTTVRGRSNSTGDSALGIYFERDY